MGYLCDKQLCTACGACTVICPVKCIIICETDLGERKAEIDESDCINCKLCAKACHMLNEGLDFIKADRVYAAWSADKHTRVYAASGGIASEICKYALHHDVAIMGTRFIRETGVLFKEILNQEDLIWARDSKYVFSDMKGTFEFYETNIKTGRMCIFIGLPCQVGAMKTYLIAKGISIDNCFFVDIICHGVPPYKYLDEHLRNVETSTNKSIKKVTFRYKSNYLLQLYTEEDSCIHSKNMDEDLYFRSFIESLNYRDNCYECRYSREERVSDITIGDYSGLGNMAEWEESTGMVSLILCNSTKGKTFIGKLVDEKKIVAIERPCEEPFQDFIGNPNLHHPSVPHPERQKFLETYRSGKNFDEVVYPILRMSLARYYIKKPFKKAYKFATSFLSRAQKKKIKRILKIFRQRIFTTMHCHLCRGNR